MQWIVGKGVTNDGQRPVVEEDIEGRRIALVDMADDSVKPRDRWKVDDPERDRIAHLISAAPELLEALEDALTQLEDYEEAISGEKYNSPLINAAIAKARGK